MSLLQFQINTGDVMQRFRTGAKSFSQVLRQEMLAQMARAADWSRSNRLSGDPLNRRTGRLSRSVTPFANSDGSRVQGGLSSNVPYAHVHEKGGTFQIPAYTRRPARTKTAGGRFKKRTEEQQVSSIQVKAHTATFPQRAFLRPALEANREQILEGLRASILRAASK